MMKRGWLLFSLFFVITLFSPKIVSAHVLQYDGSIGAVLHIDPDDDPIVGQPAYFFFDFKDKAGKFTPDECDCKAIITENGKEIYNKDLFAGNANPSLDNASFNFIFPTTDIYRLAVDGTPKTPGSFQKFSLIYNIRVARKSSSSPASSQGSGHWLHDHVWHIVIPVAIFLVTETIYFISRRKKQ